MILESLSPLKQLHSIFPPYKNIFSSSDSFESTKDCPELPKKCSAFCEISSGLFGINFTAS